MIQQPPQLPEPKPSADATQTDLTRTSPSEDARRIHQIGVTLSDYVTKTGKELHHEENRILYYLVGLALLFTLFSFPLSRLFLAPGVQWIALVPGMMVLLIATGREVSRFRRSSIRSHQETERDAQKAVLSADPSTSEPEIAMYWGYRPTAHNDLRDAVLQCTHELFVAGIALNTIGDTLCDPRVLNAVAQAKNKAPNFLITIVLLTDPRNVRALEEGGAQLRDRLERGLATLTRFGELLDERVARQVPRPLVDFRTYPLTMVPRHFLLKADAIIYTGSYLTHKHGAHSYLMKLRPAGTGDLYELFASEIEYVKRESVPVTNLAIAPSEEL